MSFLELDQEHAALEQHGAAVEEVQTIHAPAARGAVGTMGGSCGGNPRPVGKDEIPDCILHPQPWLVICDPPPEQEPIQCTGYPLQGLTVGLNQLLRYAFGAEAVQFDGPLIAMPESCLNGSFPSETTVIGRLKDLKNLRAGETTMLDRLPDQGSPRLNWQQNSGVLRSEMSKGLPIRDASVDSIGNLADNMGFLPH